MPRGTYERLRASGALRLAEGRRVPQVSTLIEVITSTWGKPASLVCDRFRIDELRDTGVPCVIVPRVTRWSESSFDIRATRSYAKDGPFSVASDSQDLLAASLAVAAVRNDDAGSFRLVKRTQNNESRDDVASAFTLASGAYARSVERTPDTGQRRHVVV